MARTIAKQQPLVQKELVLPVELKDKKPTVAVVHLHAGLDLISSKTSANSKDADIYELEYGVLLVSKKTKRKVVIPYANIRGLELL